MGQSQCSEVHDGGGGVFDVGECCGGGVGPCWCVGGSLSLLEEGIEWLDSGSTVRDEASVEIDRSPPVVPLRSSTPLHDVQGSSTPSDEVSSEDSIGESLVSSSLPTLDISELPSGESYDCSEVEQPIHVSLISPDLTDRQPPLSLNAGYISTRMSNPVT